MAFIHDYIKNFEDETIYTKDGKKNYTKLKNGDTVFFKSNGSIDFVNVVGKDTPMTGLAYANYVNSKNKQTSSSTTNSAAKSTAVAQPSTQKPALAATTAKKTNATTTLMANLGRAQNVLSPSTHEDYVDALKAEKAKAKQAQKEVKLQLKEVKKEKAELSKQAKQNTALAKKAESVLAQQKKTQELLAKAENEKQKLLIEQTASQQKLAKEKENLYKLGEQVESAKQQASTAKKTTSRTKQAAAEGTKKAAETIRKASTSYNKKRKETNAKSKADADAILKSEKEAARLQNDAKKALSEIDEENKDLEYQTKAVEAYELHTSFEIEKLWLENREKEVERQIQALENQKVRDENLETLLNALKFEELQLKELELSISTKEEVLSIDQQSAFIDARKRELANRQTQIEAETKLIEKSSMLDEAKQEKYKVLENQQQQLAILEGKVQAQEENLKNEIEKVEAAKLKAAEELENIQTAIAIPENGELSEPFMAEKEIEKPAFEKSALKEESDATQLDIFTNADSSENNEKIDETNEIDLASLLAQALNGANPSNQESIEQPEVEDGFENFVLDVDDNNSLDNVAYEMTDEQAELNNLVAESVDESTIDPGLISTSTLTLPETDAIYGNLGEDFEWLKERLSVVNDEATALQMFMNVNQMYNETGINGINLHDMHSTLLDEEANLTSLINTITSQGLLSANLRAIDDARSIAARNEKFFAMIDHPYIKDKIIDLKQAKQVSAPQTARIQNADFAEDIPAEEAKTSEMLSVPTVEALPAEAAKISEVMTIPTAEAVPAQAAMISEMMAVPTAEVSPTGKDLSETPTVQAIPVPEAQPIPTAHPAQTDTDDAPSAIPTYQPEAPANQQESYTSPVASAEPVQSQVEPAPAPASQAAPAAMSEQLEESEKPEETKKEEPAKKKGKGFTVAHATFAGLFFMSVLLSIFPPLAFMNFVAAGIAVLWGVLAVVETVVPEFKGMSEARKAGKKIKEAKQKETEYTDEISKVLDEHKAHLDAINANYAEAEKALKANIQKYQAEIAKINAELKKVSSSKVIFEKEKKEIETKLELLEKKKTAGEVVGSNYDFAKETLTKALQTKQSLIDSSNTIAYKIQTESAARIKNLENQINNDTAELERIQAEHAIKVEQEKTIISEVKLVSADRKYKMLKGEATEFPFEDFKLEDSPSTIPSTLQVNSVKFNNGGKSVGNKSREV